MPTGVCALFAEVGWGHRLTAATLFQDHAPTSVAFPFPQNLEFLTAKARGALTEQTSSAGSDPVQTERLAHRYCTLKVSAIGTEQPDKRIGLVLVLCGCDSNARTIVGIWQVAPELEAGVTQEPGPHRWQARPENVL